MINYDPKHWWGRFFAWRGTVLPYVAWPTVGITVFSVGLYGVYALLTYLGFHPPALSPLGHTLTGLALSLLLVFRTNASYDRFWEGRKLWGSLVNASRNLVRCGTIYVGDTSELAALVAAYVRVVKQTLRSNRDYSEVAGLVPPDVLARAVAAGNGPTIIAYYISAWLKRHTGAASYENAIVRTFEFHLSTMVDCQGGCERILKTPIPFIYAEQIRHMLIIYLATVPFVLIPLMGWCAPFAIAAITFGLLGIEAAGLEIEDPFGDDPNDLPLDELCATIQRDAKMVAELGEKK